MKASFTELLSPAGSPAALDAALENGADAIYLGATAFNARMNAKNFTREDLKAGIKRAHALGASIYMTLNTLVYDRELPALLDAARAAYCDGIDALIIADLGAAEAIHRILPDFPLHASTQMSGHNTDMGALLQKYGYTRMVLARETSRDNIRSFCENAPIEAEVFLHGALCVSHSGQCLFSSVVGGRSGNRGECAQPCRLPYNGAYPLSLRDLALARYIPEFIDMGVASLKIEGRMKSPEYVGAVTRVYRRLLDEKRGANDDEMRYLAEVFSRGGFTDGYYTKRIGSEMLGIRSDSDKETSRTLSPFTGLTRKAPVSFTFTARRDTPITLCAEKNGVSVTVTGEIPPLAENAPTSEETVRRQIAKLGATVYTAEKLTVTLDDGLMIPVGWLNALRRDATAALEAIDERPRDGRSPADPSDTSESLLRAHPCDTERKQERIRTARFLSAGQITKEARAYFDVRYLPLFSFDKTDAANGVILPPVVYDDKREAVRSALTDAIRSGASHVLCTNAGQLALIREAEAKSGMTVTVTGDFRLSVMNRRSLLRLTDMGIDRAILSPELSLPQMRDIAGNSEAIVYGRLPLMLLEKCVNIGRDGKKTGAPCQSCMKHHEGCADTCANQPSAVLTDRRRVSFPVFREWEHRNVVYNSVPTYMADRMDQLIRARITAHHYIFSSESPKEVDRIIDAYRTGKAPEGAVRR